MLQLSLLGDILDSEKNGCAGAPLVERLTGAQAHGAVSEVRELMLDLIILHQAVFRYDFIQQYAKLWNIPLSITECVKKFALCLLGAYLERRIEGAARSDHA